MVNLLRLLSVGLMLLGLLMPGTLYAAEKKEIVIGTHLPLTGMHAAIGMEQRWAYEEAIGDINKAGGIFVKQYNAKLPVRLVVIDDKTNPGFAAAAVERLVVQDKVDVILSGHSAAFGVIPGCVAADRYKIYYHATGCYAPPWLEHRFKYSTLLFYDIDQGAAMPFHIWATLPVPQRPTGIAILAEDTFDARVMTEAARNKAHEMGYQVALEKYWRPQSEDFSDIVAAISASGADCVFMFGPNADCIKLVRQIKRTYLPLKYIFCWRGAWSYKFWEALGQDAQYVFSDGFWSDTYPYKNAKELGERFRAEFNDNSVSVGEFYATAQILFQAIEDAGSLDPVRIRLAVLRGKFETVMGQIQYNEHGVALFECVAFQWVDGKQKLVYPLNLATGHPQMLP